MFHRAVELKYLDGTAIEVLFQDGMVKQYDISDLFSKYPQLKALEDREIFLQGKLSAYGIIWNDDLDLETETIYEEEKQSVQKNRLPICLSRRQLPLPELRVVCLKHSWLH